MYYAVNKRTKEHRVFKEGCQLGYDEELISANDEGWIKWHGDKECPLPDNKRCEVVLGHLRDPWWPSAAIPANYWHWGWEKWGSGSNITAYRPVLDGGKTQVPEWDGLPPVGAYVKVRRNDNDWLVVKVAAVADDGGIIYRDPASTERSYKWAIGSDIRPIPSDREQWIEAAKEHFCDDDATATMEFIYDAIRSGELSIPKDM